MFRDSEETGSDVPTFIVRSTYVPMFVIRSTYVHTYAHM
jgi:hypothetical protein